VVDDFIHAYLYTPIHPPPPLAASILQQNVGRRVEEDEGKQNKVDTVSRLGPAASGFDLVAKFSRTGTGKVSHSM
jgi:hypothetical protein